MTNPGNSQQAHNIPEVPYKNDNIVRGHSDIEAQHPNYLSDAEYSDSRTSASPYHIREGESSISPVQNTADKKHARPAMGSHSQDTEDLKINTLNRRNSRSPDLPAFVLPVPQSQQPLHYKPEVEQVQNMSHSASHQQHNYVQHQIQPQIPANSQLSVEQQYMKFERSARKSPGCKVTLKGNGN